MCLLHAVDHILFLSILHEAFNFSAKILTWLPDKIMNKQLYLEIYGDIQEKDCLFLLLRSSILKTHPQIRLYKGYKQRKTCIPLTKDCLYAINEAGYICPPQILA